TALKQPSDSSSKLISSYPSTDASWEFAIGLDNRLYRKAAVHLAKPGSLTKESTSKINKELESKSSFQPHELVELQRGIEPKNDHQNANPRRRDSQDPVQQLWSK